MKEQVKTREQIFKEFEDNTLRQEVRSRGGGVEIDLKYLGFENEKMTAYQNYLGGGMLGRIGNDSTILKWWENEELKNIAEQLREYFFYLMFGEFDQGDYDEMQTRPLRGY